MPTVLGAGGCPHADQRRRPWSSALAAGLQVAC
jgi:hypothetical protein